MIFLFFFLVVLGAGVAVVPLRLRQNEKAIASQDRRAYIEYRAHLAQLPNHVAQLERECGLDVARWTYDMDEYDKLQADGIEVYDYHHLPKSNEKWDDTRGGFYEFQDAQEMNVKRATNEAVFPYLRRL
jgi:hypothetical protein